MGILAMKHITNDIGIAILEIDHSEDSVVTTMVHGKHIAMRRKSRLRTDKQGHIYFMKNGYKEYIADYMRV